MSDEGSLTARAAMTWGTKVTLRVEGQAMAYSSDAKLVASERTGDFNPTFFGVDVIIKEGSGPRKGVMRDWSFSKVIDDADSYEKVLVRAVDNESGDTHEVLVDILKDRN